MTSPAAPRYNYAARARHFVSSPVRGIFDISMRPGMITLAGGNPDLTVLPLDHLSAVSSKLITERGTEVLQYGHGAGVEELREAVCELMALTGIQATYEDVQITSGSQMGIELITTMLCDPGDVILAESPTYVGALGTFEGLEADVRHVPCDTEGLEPESLRASIHAVRAEGKRIAFLYTIPTFSNPTGIRLSVERRQQIVDVCREEHVQIVEDDPYSLLSFDGVLLPALRSLDDTVVYLGSLSKICSPGIRVGWMLAPAELRERLQLASEATTICASVLSQYLALEYLTKIDWRAVVSGATDRYRSRAEAVVAGLEKHMPADVSWTTPTGGFFTWLTIDRDIDTEARMQASIDAGLVYIPGSAFFAAGQGASNTLRLSYSLAQEATADEAMRRLAQVINA